MSKGGGTTVQKSDPWSGVQPYLKTLYGKTDEQLNNALPFYSGQTYAGFDPLQTASQQGMLDYSQGLAPQIGDYQSGLFGFMNAPQDITNDPAVQNMFRANERSVMDTLTRDMIPAISRGASSAGVLGGSKDQQMDALAVGEASKALANANAQTALGAYGTAAGLAGQAAGLMPGSMQLGFLPSQTQMNVGSMLQGMDQKAIDEAMARYYYPEQSAWSNLANASGIYSGAGNYGVQSTKQPGSDPFATALGVGMMAAPSILGFAPFFSDRRLKTNIIPLGKRGEHQWYEFEYKDPEKHGHGKFIGVMADEVEKINPDAVTEIDGYKAVYYGKL